MSEEFEPCPVPWCVLPSGIDIQPEHYAPHLTHGGGSPGGWAVMCGTCGCQGPRKSTKAEARAAWNKRPGDEVMDLAQKVADTFCICLEEEAKCLAGQPDRIGPATYDNTESCRALTAALPRKP